MCRSVPNQSKKQKPEASSQSSLQQKNKEEKQLRPVWLLGHLAISCIRFYQQAISPLTGSRCRFQPTCSQYGIEAIKKHGVLYGLLKTFWRICRCTPLGKGGFDPP